MSSKMKVLGLVRTVLIVLHKILHIIPGVSVPEKKRSFKSYD